jgi:hypothetical protein
VAATTPDDTHEEPAEEPKPSLLDSFSQADLKLFLITFAGTVAANVVALMFVGLAVLLVRVVGTPSGPVEVVMVVLVLFMCVGIATLLMVWRKEAPESQFLLWSAGVLSMFALVWVLTLLGWATGVK